MIDLKRPTDSSFSAKPCTYLDCLQIPIVISLLLPLFAHESKCGEWSCRVVDDLHDTRCYRFLNALCTPRSTLYLLIIFRTISEQKALGRSLAQHLIIIVASKLWDHPNRTLLCCRTSICDPENLSLNIYGYLRHAHLASLSGLLEINKAAIIFEAFITTILQPVARWHITMNMKEPESHPGQSDTQLGPFGCKWSERNRSIAISLTDFAY